MKILNLPEVHSRSSGRKSDHAAVVHFDPFRDLQIKSLRQRESVRKAWKACFGVLSSTKPKEQLQAPPLRLPLKDPDKSGTDDPIRHFNENSRSTFLNITDLDLGLLCFMVDYYLVTESQLALWATCKTLRRYIGLTKKEEVSRRDRLKFLALCARDSPYAQQGSIVCEECVRIRPRTAFAGSVVESLGKERIEECLRHSRIWTCHHESYSQEQLAALAETHDFETPKAPLLNSNHTMCCGKPDCDSSFQHTISRSFASPPSYILHTSILVKSICHTGLDREIPLRIGTDFSKTRLQLVFWKMDVPVCDHWALNDQHMFSQLGKRIGDVEITDEREDGDYHGSSTGKEYPIAACARCKAAGTRTECRLNIVILPAPDERGIFIELRVILTRELGGLELFDEKETHWRNHAMTAEKLSRFVKKWSIWTG